MVQIQGVEAPNHIDYENQKEKIIFALLFPLFIYLSNIIKGKQLLSHIVVNLKVKPSTIS